MIRNSRISPTATYEVFDDDRLLEGRGVKSGRKENLTETVLQTQLLIGLCQGREQLPERHEGAALLGEKR